MIFKLSRILGMQSMLIYRVATALEAAGRLLLLLLLLLLFGIVVKLKSNTVDGAVTATCTILWGRKVYYKFTCMLI
jgi:hypothetical protein